MVLVLEGLAGIKDVEMDLGRDAFTIAYDPERVDPEAILARIRMLGYRPEAVELGDPRPDTDDLGPATEPVATALARAKADDELLLLDFYAAWCGPCKTMESRVLTDTRVRNALRNMTVLRIDTDVHTEPSDRFGVVGLPTLIVVDGDGREVYRREGLIEPAQLAADLDALSSD